MQHSETTPKLVHTGQNNNQIRFFYADCLMFMKTIPDGYYDLAIIDPPYRDANQPTKEMRAINGGQMKDFGIKPPPEYWGELFRVSKNQIVWGANNFIEHLKNTNCFIFWNKMQAMDNYSDGELAWTSFDSVAKHFQYCWAGNLSGFPGQIKSGNKRIHPTQKPVALYQWLLQKYAKVGDRILDTHGGSMTHAIACELEGFELDICECNEMFFNIGTKAFNEHSSQNRLF